MKYLLILFVFYTGVCSAQIKTYDGKLLDTAHFTARIARAMDSMNVKGMSIGVISNGAIVYRKGFGVADVASGKKATPDTYFEAASLSKAVFASYVLKNAKEGLLHLDTPLFRYLPDPNITDDRYKAITARMVLSHMTGLPNWRDTPAMKLLSAPGTRFSYSGEAYMYLARVMAHLTGRTLASLDEHFQRSFAKPYGLKQLHFLLRPGAEANMATGYQGDLAVFDERDRTVFDAAGGLYANIPTFGNFLLRLMQDKKEFSAMFRPASTLPADDPIRQYFGITTWTAGLALQQFGKSVVFWHGGNNLGFTSSFAIDPDRGFGYVFFTNADQCHGMKSIIESMLWGSVN